LLFLFRTGAKARARLGVAMAAAGLGLGVAGAVAAGAYLLGSPAYAAAPPYAGPLAPPPKSAPTIATGVTVMAAPTLPERPVLIPVPAPPTAAAPFRAADQAVSQRDLDCLAAAVYYEARGEASDGQAAVAQVVLNRARAPSYPKNVCGVVYQGAGDHECQFSFVCNGAMRRPREPAAWTRARDVATRALHGYVMAMVGHATCFHAARLGGGGGHAVRLGGHVFFGGGAGRDGPAAAYRTVSLPRAEPTGPDRPRLTFALGVLTPVATATPPSPAKAALAAS
jgi:hypothetical protein